MLCPGACADLRIDGDRLHVATGNIRMVFQGGDIVEITNRRTGEKVSSGLSRRNPMTGIVTATGQVVPLRSDGWRRGRENEEGREAAQTVLRGPNQTIWLNVVLDKETDDVVVGLWAESSVMGVRGARLAIRNLDLSVGELMLPTLRDPVYTRTHRQTERLVTYPSEWLSQMLIWQNKAGGIVFYSRDEEQCYKAVNLSRQGDYVDLTLETRAPGPWDRATSVPFVEWRINAYEGTWRVPAAGYKRLMAFLWPRTTPPESRLWVGQVRTFVTVPEGAGQAWLDELAARERPARTVLVLENWSETPPPEYRMTYLASVFISAARARGFYVMLPVHVQQAAEAAGEQSSKETSAVNSRTVMNPASRAWRSRVIRGLREAFAGTKPDALLILDGAEVVPDADAGSGRSGLWGMLELLRELQAAFPDVVLCSRGVHELLIPHIRIVKYPGEGPPRLPPLTEYLFGDMFVWFPAPPPDTAEKSAEGQTGTGPNPPD